MVDPYKCTRCGYTTRNKTNIKKHLYDKKMPCPSTKNQIDLTEEIKLEIITNRVYHIKKKETTNLTGNDKGDIYLFYTRASKNSDEPVYKIGKAQDYIKRQGGYDKGGNMLFVVNVTNRHDCENIVKSAFQKEFKQRRDYGHEYFEGDVFEMVLTIKDILSEYITETLIEFKYLS